MIPVFVLLALGGLMRAVGDFAGIARAGGTELAFGYLLLCAYFTARLVSRIGLPKLTGYLASGIIVGPHVLGLVAKPMTAQLSLVSGTATAILALTARRRAQPAHGAAAAAGGVPPHRVRGVRHDARARRHAGRAAPAGAVPRRDAGHRRGRRWRSAWRWRWPRSRRRWSWR